jgi:hypothetical protein
MTQRSDGLGSPESFPGEAAVPWLEFSCYRAHGEGINDGSLKVLLPGMGGLLPLARVGSWVRTYALVALACCPKNVPVDEARAAGITTAGCPQLTAGGSDHGR